MIAICGALLWLPGHPQFQIEYFVYAQTVAYLLTAVTAFVVLVGTTGFRRLRFNKPFSLVILKKSLPFALLVLLMASYNRIDPVLLQKLSPAGLGDHNAGIYASAFRLLDALTMIAYLVSVALLPIFSKLTKGGAADGQLAPTTRLVTSLMLVFSITTAIALSRMSVPLMELLYTHHIGESAAVFRILVYGIIPISMTYVYGTLLTAAGRMRQLNLLAALTLLINITVNLFGIPRWGAVGSAWASLTAQSFMAVTQMVAAIRLFHLPISGGYIIKTILFTLLIIVFSLLPPIWGIWWLHLVLVVIIASALAVLLKLIDPKEIIETLK